jgi:hypothetical protein
MLVIYVKIVGMPMGHIFPCIIRVTRDLGRTLESFTSCLACQVQVNPGNWLTCFKSCESRGS